MSEEFKWPGWKIIREYNLRGNDTPVEHVELAPFVDHAAAHLSDRYSHAPYARDEFVRVTAELFREAQRNQPGIAKTVLRTMGALISGVKPNDFAKELGGILPSQVIDFTQISLLSFPEELRPEKARSIAAGLWNPDKPHNRAILDDLIEDTTDRFLGVSPDEPFVYGTAMALVIKKLRE